MGPAGTLSLQQVTNKQNEPFNGFMVSEAARRQPLGSEGLPRAVVPGLRGPRRLLGARVRGTAPSSPEGAASRGRPPPRAHLAPSKGAAPGRGRGRRAGAETARGRDPAPRAAPPRDDAAPADSPACCHSLLTMVAAQSNKPGRPLPP